MEIKKLNFTNKKKKKELTFHSPILALRCKFQSSETLSANVTMFCFFCVNLGHTMTQINLGRQLPIWQKSKTDVFFKATPLVEKLWWEGIVLRLQQSKDWHKVSNALYQLYDLWIGVIHSWGPQKINQPHHQQKWTISLFFQNNRTWKNGKNFKTHPFSAS